MDSQNYHVQRIERITNYQRTYMRKERECKYCNRSYKLYSYYRHCKSPKHLKNKELCELQDIIDSNIDKKI